MYIYNQNNSFVKLKFKKMLRNGLYIISTPIGNLQDISERALLILREVQIVACEDTRVSKKLFTLLGISLNKKFITYQDHNEEDMAQKIADLAAEQPVALISDAGSPLISDPGYKLVRLCRKFGVYVTAIPGACALISALQLSGLPTNRFMFAGREVAAVREISKMYEETISGSIAEVIEYFAQNEPKGEFVLIVAPPQEKNTEKVDLRPILAQRLRQTSLKTAVKEVCAQYNLNKNEVYALALEIKNEQLS